ncbi:glycine-rich RNA-binding protein 4, mitochondrial-like, partial [Mangifera indica]|uniref:glycine-rich RNA-binding protein 4, mitochondrial-like n=1 Tax=Mangifera indica TaxID=29780 RepID=UPI001CFB44CE
LRNDISLAAVKTPKLFYEWCTLKGLKPCQFILSLHFPSLEPWFLVHGPTAGLFYGTDEMSLKEAFSGFGEVVEARVKTDRDRGRSRGFGFVNFTSDDSASSALPAMDGQVI